MSLFFIAADAYTSGILWIFSVADVNTFLSLNQIRS